jgi:flagellar basal-body rod protein FlgG
MRSLDIAGTGMQAQQTNVEVISNNIANMTTTGFKRRRPEFQDLISHDWPQQQPTVTAWRHRLSRFP